MSRVIPTINTHRLTLRAMRPEDFDRYAEIWRTPDVIRFISAEPWTRDTAWGAFLRNAGHWHMTGFGQWVVEEHATKRMIGQTGFFYGARGYGEDFDSWPEAGWVLAPEAHGQRYASEATRAAHDWFDRVVTGPLVCQIVSENEASMRLARQLGYLPLRKRDDVDLMIRKGPP